MNPAPSGLIILHKQPGFTSFDALRDIKRALGTGKVCHTGTLDKFAEGLLLVLTGRALKLSRWFTHCDKQYEGTICFGTETDTLDPEGLPIAKAPLPSRDAVEQVLPQFRGSIEQAPPAYSAIHINGERASALARHGKAPDMQKRPVTVYRLELISWEPPFVRVFVHCSSGTYIRSLARDMALAAGSRGYLSALLRTRVGGFGLEDALRGGEGSRESGVGSWREGEGSREQQTILSTPHSLLPIDQSIFERLNIPCIEISSENAAKVIQGKPLSQIIPAAVSEHSSFLIPHSSLSLALFSNNELMAIIERSDDRDNRGCLWKYGYVYARD